MYKCNVCGAVFDSPAEQKREVEYIQRPFGNGSEPYGGGYYECCPECGEEDFEEYEEDKEELTDKYYKQDICVDCGRCRFYHPLFTQGQCEYYNQWCELKKQLALTEKALKLACESIENMCLTPDNVEKPMIKIKWVEYFKNMAKEIKSE